MSDKLIQVLNEAIEYAQKNHEGGVAAYIPELAEVNPEQTRVAISLPTGEAFAAGDFLTEKTTLQSTAKVVVLIGMLEEFGLDALKKWVRMEPSAEDFASVAMLDQYGPKPSNPMLNAGAISLCAYIPGKTEDQFAWLEKWMEKLFHSKLHVNQRVFASERRTGDRNRSIAYLLKSEGIISGNVEAILESYFFSCSFEADIKEASYLPMLLANSGRDPEGQQVISEKTVEIVLALMATCGLYSESGIHLVKTGMPAKSGVAGFLLSSAIGRAGVAVMSPRVNRKGNSIRGAMMLEYISRAMGWHFAHLKPEA